MNLKTLLIVATILLPTTVFAKDLEIPIPCAPTAIVPPPSLTRVQGDGDIWNFKLVAAPNSNVTFSKQDWSFNTQNPVAEPNNPDNPAGPGLIANWGRFGGGDGTNSLSWDAPNESGTFTVSVHAKRHCGGGGGGGGGGEAVNEDFDASWTTTVVKIDSVEVDSGATVIGDGANTPERTDVCAASKNITGTGVIILKAVLEPAVLEAQIPAGTIVWTDNGQAIQPIAGSQLKVQISKAAWAKHEVKATVGNTSYTMVAYVVGAKKQSFKAQGNFSPENNSELANGIRNLGGFLGLVGPFNNPDNGPGPADGSYFTNTEMAFKVQPDDLITDATNGKFKKTDIVWDITRDKRTKGWQKSGRWFTFQSDSIQWTPDDLLNRTGQDKDVNPWDGSGLIFSIDQPGSLDAVGGSGLINYGNFREWVRVAFGNGAIAFHQGGSMNAREATRVSEYIYWRAFRANKFGTINLPNQPPFDAWTIDELYKNVASEENKYWDTVPTFEVVTPTIINGQVQVVYSQNIRSSAGDRPISWRLSAGNLPPGLSLSVQEMRIEQTQQIVPSDTALISGTPTVAGTYNFTVEAKDSFIDETGNAAPRITTHIYQIIVVGN